MIAVSQGGEPCHANPDLTLLVFPQHVIQRGNNREPCFFAEQDYRRYLNDLREAAEKYRCRIHAYVLMTNHIHILVIWDGCLN